MKVTAAIVRNPGGPFTLETADLEAPRRGEVLVRIAAAGMCHTDLAVRDQDLPVPLPVVLGHEGAGVVEAVGEGVTKVRPGDPVVLTYLSCGGCRNCVSGRQSYCEAVWPLNFGGGRLDGSSPLAAGAEALHGAFFGQSSFATYAVASERNVVKAPPDAPLEMLGPLGCGFQTGAGAIINVLKPAPGASLAIYGVGAVGMSALLAAKALGVTTVIAVDLNAERLKLALELGAAHAVNPGETPDIAKRIRTLTGRGADYALETTAHPEVLRQAVDALAIPGVCGFVGAAAPGTMVSLEMASLMMGKSVVGIVEGDSVPDVFIPYLIDLFMAGRFPIDKLIAFYPLSEINTAAADSLSGKVVKPVLRP